MSSLIDAPLTTGPAGAPDPAADVPSNGPVKRHPRRRRRLIILGCIMGVLAAGAGVFAYLWFHSGPHQVSMSTAIHRFQQGDAPDGQTQAGTGPAAGVYLYRGTGTESISVPPKSQSEGPGIPGTITRQPNGCFEFRLDYSSAHWQSSTYCLRNGALVNPTRSGYYKWDFVAFAIDDTSTITCVPPVVTIPENFAVGTTSVLRCTGTNNHISIGPVSMKGTLKVTGTGTIRVGDKAVPAVRVREHFVFSGGQSGTNDADTWFSVATGMPLECTWSTVVTTPSVVGNTTLNAHGVYSLTSLTPSR